METERELLLAIQEGEHEAQRRLYDRFSGYAMAIAMRYVPQQDGVHDVMQDSFVKILTSIQRFSYRGEGSLKSWVASIVSHQAVDYIREHERFVSVDGFPDEPDEGEPDARGVPPDVLTAMIGQLPVQYRTVLNLFVFEQWSHREIARQLGIKENTSSSIFFRARKMLSKKIKDYLNNPQR